MAKYLFPLVFVFLYLGVAMMVTSVADGIVGSGNVGLGLYVSHILGVVSMTK